MEETDEENVFSFPQHLHNLAIENSITYFMSLLGSEIKLCFGCLRSYVFLVLSMFPFFLKSKKEYMYINIKYN